jgi:hypothetical protein
MYFLSDKRNLVFNLRSEKKLLLKKNSEELKWRVQGVGKTSAKFAQAYVTSLRIVSSKMRALVVVSRRNCDEIRYFHRKAVVSHLSSKA